jgi:Tat protein translocase TatB subunit
MFGIGMQEILIILVIALVVIGPKKLPEMAKALGKGYGEFRRAFEDMRSSINVDMKTDDESERLRHIREKVGPPTEKPAPEPLVESAKPAVRVTGEEIPVPPEAVTAPAVEEPTKKETPQPAPSLPEYGTDEEDIEGGGD